MKKLLIIQTSNSYFLLETMETVYALEDDLKLFEVSLVVNADALAKIDSVRYASLQNKIVTEEKALLSEFDMSVNLSLDESSWTYHQKVNSKRKLGPVFNEGRVTVSDMWSSYLLTLKSNAPFVTFHLQDIYRNILGIKKVPTGKFAHKNPKYLILGLFNPDYFSVAEQEEFTNGLQRRFPHLEQKDFSEISKTENLEDALYVGPPHVDALKACTRGALGVFITARFQGFNLLPYEDGHHLITTDEKPVFSKDLIPAVSAVIKTEHVPKESPYSHYQNDHDLFFGAYLKTLHHPERVYPVYQAHVVLWNFVLNLMDVSPDIFPPTPGQTDALNTHLEVLTKVLRLHDYAMVSLKTIYDESKSSQAKGDIIEGHLKNLRDMENTFDMISQSHPLMRPLIDFYRIRKGQNEGSTLLEQTSNSIITYTEEHQAIQAYLELLKTLRDKK